MDTSACWRSGRRPATSPATTSTAQQRLRRRWRRRARARRVPVNGQIRKVMIQPNKNGFLYVLDRTNCTLIAAHPFVKVNSASHVDLATGRPVLTDVYKRFLAGEEVGSGRRAAPTRCRSRSTPPPISSTPLHRTSAHPEAAPPQPIVIGERSTGPPHASRRRSRATRWAISWQWTRSRARRSGNPAGAAKFSPGAGNRRRTALHRLADRRVRGAGRSHGRRCGSSRAARASTRPP